MSLLDGRYDVDPNTGCHVWRGSRNGNGYGKLRVGRKQMYAHRVAFEEACRPLAPGETIDHLCRNRSCCNPTHLEAVSLRENIARRPPNLATRCSRGHEMSGENLHVDGAGRRRCRACRNPNRKPNRPYLSKGEKAQIADWVRQGVPVDEVAKRVNRHVMTIKRTINRLNACVQMEGV